MDERELLVKLNRQEMDIAKLERQILSLRRQCQQMHDWLDTVNSPLYKRIWWFIRGYNFYTVGRWYGKYE